MTPKFRYTCAVFIINEAKVLMIKHKKLQRWLPPGGLIENNETPDQAALREVHEETGLKIKLLGKSTDKLPDVTMVHPPIHIQVENNPHGPDNIDFIYYAELQDVSAKCKINKNEIEEFTWMNKNDLNKHIPEEEIRLNCLRALNY